MPRSPRPWHFFFLVLPYGASFGFVSPALPYLARQHGVDVAAISVVVSAAFWPHSLKLFWAPVVDTTLSRKTWYAIALALVSLGTLVSMAMPIEPSSLRALMAVVVVSQIGLTLMGMSCASLIGLGLPGEQKGAAAGWLTAGASLALGVGGGAAIEIITHFGGAVAGVSIATALIVCGFPLLLFDEPLDPGRPPLGKALRALLRDLWRLAGSRQGIAALFICASPVGSGAASNLFGAMADEWHASRATVALTTGALGGVASALGAGAGGWVAARMNRRTAYALAGALTAMSGVAMALAPHAAWAYAVFTLVYLAWNGLAYAAFSAFAFETIGKTAIATGYSVLASLVNLSVVYATRIDGAAHTRWGGSGLLYADAAMTAAGIVVLLALR